MKTICKNCGKTVRGNYCQNCGQAADTGKVSWRFCLNELILNNFSLNRGVFYTARSLLIHPQKMVREYLAGKRKRYTGALHFLVFVLVLRGLLNLIFGERGTGDVLGFQIQLSEVPIEFQQYDRIMILVLTLVPSFVNYALYKRLKYSLAEHFYINAYVVGISILLIIVLNILTLFKWPEWFNLFPLLVISFYVRIFYDKKQTLGGVLKGLLVFLLGILFLIVLVILVAIAVALVLRLFSNSVTFSF